MPARPRRRPDPTSLGRTFRRRLRHGPPLLGGIAMEYLRPSLVKLYAAAGFDFLYVEKEHGFLEGPALSDFILCARDNGLPVVSKIGELGRAETARLLEAGVTAIQLPRAESRAQIEELLDYVKFPPAGSRAGAPCYGNVDYVWPADDAGWLHKANQSTLVVAHIETAAGYAQAGDIITTPGLDMVYVGPYDFSIAMGHPGDYDHADVRGPMHEILTLCRRHDVAFGTTASGPEAGRSWVSAGCRFFEVVDELTLIADAAGATVDGYRAFESEAPA